MNIIKIDKKKKKILIITKTKRTRVECMLGKDMKLAEKEQRKVTREHIVIKE